MKQLNPQEIQRLKAFWRELRGIKMDGGIFLNVHHELCLGEISAGFEMWHDLTRQAFQQMTPEDKHDFDVFQQRLCNIEQHVQNLPDQQVQLWLPSTVNCPPGTVLHSGKHTFTYRTQAEAEAETQVLFKGVQPQGEGRPPKGLLNTGFWTIRLDALSPEDAWDKISLDFTMLRASHDYTFTKANRSWNNFGVVHQTSFLQPAWIYGESENGNPTVFSFVEQKLLGDPSHCTLPTGGEAHWQRFLTALTSGEPDFQAWRTEVLSRWLSARDAFLEHDALFGCWQTLEHLTLSEDKGGHTDAVKSRLKSILQDSRAFKSLPAAFLDRLARVRNDLTHNRAYAPDYSALEASRYITQRGVDWMLQLDPLFTTLEHVRSFFTLATLNTADLRRTLSTAGPVALEVGEHLQNKRKP